MSIRPRRSVLYMPGSNARALEKAKTLPADALILDLEDAVAPDVKDAAREQVCAAVVAGGYGGREIVIRTNARETPWYAADLAAAARAAPDAILVPKVSSAQEVMQIAADMQAAGVPAQTRLWAMIETPAGLLDVAAIAATAADPVSRLAVFVLGTNDIAKETRARFVAGRAPMLAALSMTVLAARAHGVEVIDGVFNDIGNEAGLRAECEQGRDFGMDGKTLIHPGQVAIANEIFAPSEADLAWGRKIIAAFDLPENASKGALQLEGRMIERLHADMARRTVAIAEAIAARG